MVELFRTKQKLDKCLMKWVDGSVLVDTKCGLSLLILSIEIVLAVVVIKFAKFSTFAKFPLKSVLLKTQQQNRVSICFDFNDL